MTRTRRELALVALTLVVAACSGAASTPAASTGTPATSPGAASVAPTGLVGSSPPPTSTAGPATATNPLDAVTSYRFRLLIEATGGEPLPVDPGVLPSMSGVIVLQPTAAYRVTFDGMTGSPGTGGATITRIGSEAWLTAADGTVTVLAADVVSGLLGDIRPEHPFAAGWVEFGALFERVADENRDGVAVVHWRATPDAVARMAGSYALAGPAEAEMWIAADGGWIAGALITGATTGEDGSVAPFRVTLEIGGVDDPANLVAPPG